MNLPQHELLHQRAIECVKNYKRSEKELIDVLSEMDQTRGYLPFGVPSLFRYCVERLGLSESETMRFTQVTRKAQVVPGFREAINQGLLTVSQASRIAPVITNETQSAWIEKARTLNQREIEREVAKVNPKAVRRDRIEIRTQECSELRVTISNDLETKIKRAQEVLGAKNLLETLEKLVDLALKQKDPLIKAERSQARKNLKTGEIKAQLPASRQTPSPLPVRQVVSAGLRHAIFNRDRGQCGFKKCGQTRWLHMHHIQPLSMGGKNDLANLMLLCSSHHRMMHEKSPQRTATAK